MHLKSLTLKGFKSFASSTTLDFETGVTAVVGPNGSGKSNVVDALAWVMGEQGAKALRGGKMEDVIFAGTAGRPPLGRAEVNLTIDNSDGALPIDYTEVTISRIMFRSGGSEYAINGNACRLLDVQELLSDSGIGREMHVIVGQGQLDSILHATAEDRRGFIEEAAGVLKHRKRKEKALRKLDGLAEKLARLQDLSVELRRQLKPLGRQAEVARRAAVIQADLRDAQLRLLADDFTTATTALEREVADEEALLHAKAQREAELLALRSREAQLQSAAEEAEPLLASAEDLWHRLTKVAERLRGIAAVAAERSAMLDAAQPARSGKEPAQLRADADRVAGEHAGLAAQAKQEGDEVAALKLSRAQTEAELGAQLRAAEEHLAAQDRCRTGVARAESKLSAAEAAVAARAAESERAGQDEASARSALESIESEPQQDAAPSSEGDLAALQAALERAKAERGAASTRTAECRTVVQQAQRAHAGASARAETLGTSLAAMDANGGAGLLTQELRGVLGGVAEVLHVEEARRTAVVAALGAVAEGIAVDGLQEASRGLALLRERGVDRAELIIADPESRVSDAQPPVGQRLVDAVRTSADLAATVDQLLGDFVLVQDLDQALALLQAGGPWIAVTPDGDVLARTWARGGVRDGSSRWEMQEELARAHEAVQASEEALQAAQRELDQAVSAEDERAGSMEQARTRWQDARTVQAAADERVSQWHRRVTAARQRLASAEHRSAELTRAVEQDRAARETAAAALVRAREALAELPEPEPGKEPQLRALLEQQRGEETEARLRLRTTEERAASLGQRVQALRRAADEEERSREKAEQAFRAGQRRAAVAVRVGQLATTAQRTAEEELAAVSSRREQLREQSTARQAELASLRAQSGELAAEVARLTDSVHRDEVARAEQRLRIEQLAERALTEFGIATDVLAAEYGPTVLVPPSAPAPGDAEEGPSGEAEPYPYDRQAQERRLRSAERSLALLGKVNPLALEEFAALEERYAYLNEQIDDVQRSRTDLLGIVKDVDARVQQVFAEAYADTAAEFGEVFGRLFPGGEGRLVLTQPDDLLATGVEVEARPPGKKVKRLSLLSGGERSLTAVAFLIALFRARPSPFYVLDEVEAALDDTNLGRLIQVIEELRANSQLIVITHQKRTMEAADALYGVSMRGDGVTQVISQRIADPESASPRDVVDLRSSQG